MQYTLAGHAAMEDRRTISYNPADLMTIAIGDFRTPLTGDGGCDAQRQLQPEFPDERYCIKEMV